MQMIDVAGSYINDIKFASLKNVGDAVIGVIVDGREAQATFKGQPQFWPPKANQMPEPKMELRLTIRQDDGTEVLLSIPKDKQLGSRQTALRDAIRKSGLDGLPLGARIKMQVTERAPRDDDPNKFRYIHQAAIKAPQVSVD